MYRRSRFNEELGQSPGAESPAVNAPSDMRVDMSPSPEGLGKFRCHTDLRLPMEGFVRLYGSSSYHYYFFNRYRLIFLKSIVTSAKPSLYVLPVHESFL